MSHSDDSSQKSRLRYLYLQQQQQQQHQCQHQRQHRWYRVHHRQQCLPEQEYRRRHHYPRFEPNELTHFVGEALLDSADVRAKTCYSMHPR